MVRERKFFIKKIFQLTKEDGINYITTPTEIMDLLESLAENFIILVNGSG